ncbi:MAG: TonB-dependent receptor [Opitutales bacterium]|nr:TonB-dependent receptor [Opitutales bacterium]
MKQISRKAAYCCALSVSLLGTLNAQDAGEDEDVLLLTPFEVESSQDVGYLATSTLAGTRIRTDMKDVGSAISVVTKEMLDDIGAIDNSTLLQYTTNAEVSGTRGTYAGLGNAQEINETSQLRQPAGGQRVRGLDSADNTRDFFGTDIPWDNYNVDRIDIQRGPNSMLFGLGSPAGIINASLNNAEYADFGEVELRIGSYGSNREAVDINREIIPGVLAVRVDAVLNNERYKQDQAFEDAKRIYGAVRFEPKIFSSDFKTSIKAKFENGNVKANRPRITTPIDLITPWFTSVEDGGLGKYTVTDPYELGSTPEDTNPWLNNGGINQQQPVWFIDGATGTQSIYSGYINTGAIKSDGTAGNVSESIQGQRYSNTFTGLRNYPSYAYEADLEGNQYGQYRNQSMTDSTIFDFYNNLIDGNTKSEWEDWNAYNLSFTQMGWGDRVGLSVDYDHQEYTSGGQSLLSNPTISVDINQYLQDGSLNPNYGRAYVVGGPGTGSSYDSKREFFRSTLFGEFRASDLFDEDSLMTKILGKHRLNGSYSKETYTYEKLGWNLYAHDAAWGQFWKRSDNVEITDRVPVANIYLGDSLASANTASGAYIPGITGNVALNDGNVYLFESTWNATGVNYSDPWTVPDNIAYRYGDVWSNPPTQASNPDNYVGWNSNRTLNLLSYDAGDTSLYTSAEKTVRKTESYAGTWQGFMLNDAIVGTFGWRYDTVKTKDAKASAISSNRNILNMSSEEVDGTEGYNLPDDYPEDQIFKAHSTSYSVVAHLNKFFPKDPLPIDISLTYNESDNFRVTSVRRNIYGAPISNPQGDTKEYGILLSTKDGRYSFRAIKYETNMTGVSVDMNTNALSSTVAGGLAWRNVFLYRLSSYTWDTREDPYKEDYGEGYTRNTWHPAWIDNDTGRPVAGYGNTWNPEHDPSDEGYDDLNPAPENAYFETREQAIEHRDAVINAWNDIQRYLEALGYFDAWNYTPTTTSALTDRSTYEAAMTSVGPTSILGLGGHGTADIPAAQYIPVENTVGTYGTRSNPGFAVTSDTASEGYEFEFTANPTDNWRISFNASKTTANRFNVGGEVLDSFVNYMDEQMSGIAGDMRRWNGDFGSEIRTDWFSWRNNYTLLKLNENAAASEIRKWRYNIITNYSFSEGLLKGAGVGCAYRWQDKVIIGYPVLPGEGYIANYDLENPYYGPTEDGFDFWISYERPITEKIGWKIQLNVRNAFQDEGLIPISTQPDGSYASVRIRSGQEWTLTNSFTF